MVEGLDFFSEMSALLQLLRPCCVTHKCLIHETDISKRRSDAPKLKLAQSVALSPLDRGGPWADTKFF